jgi:hypothetical protein
MKKISEKEYKLLRPITIKSSKCSIIKSIRYIIESNYIFKHLKNYKKRYNKSISKSRIKNNKTKIVISYFGLRII